MPQISITFLTRLMSFVKISMACNQITTPMGQSSKSSKEQFRTLPIKDTAAIARLRNRVNSILISKSKCSENYRRSSIPTFHPQFRANPIRLD